MPDAAWLADPTGRFQYRYWDGSQWSAAVSRQGSQETDELATQPPPPGAPAPQPPPPPPSVSGPAPPPWPGDGGPPPPAWPAPAPRAGSSERDWSAGMRVAVLVTAAVLLIGSCLTWVKATAGPFTATRGGLSGDGRITIGIAIAVGLLFLLLRQRNLVAWLIIIGGVLAAATTLYDIGNIKQRASDLSTSTVSIQATIGVGLILCAIAGIALVVVGCVAVAEARRT